MDRPAAACPSAVPQPFAVLACHLTQLADTLAGLDAAHYAQLPMDLPGATASIGLHVRHVLDHLQAFHTGLATGLVTYDRRERGTAMETDCQAAVAQCRALAAQFAALAPARGLQPLQVEAVLAPDQPPVVVASTAAREAVFLLSHTVHHQALIALLASHYGHRLPAAFAYAPSTLAWLQRSPCAPSP
jgi:hypothetical protein